MLRYLTRGPKLVRRQLFVLRLMLEARLKRATVHLDIAPDLDLGPRVKFQIQPGTTNRITIGRGCRIRENVHVLLRGGELYFGELVEVRRGTTINLSGKLTCVGRNIFSHYNIVHCAESITLDLYASTNEFVSIIDSTHHHDGPNEFFYENVSEAPIYIGRNSWICNKSSVLMGVRIGHNCVVASHAVVNKDVPDGMIAAGVPAKVIAPRAVGGPALAFFDSPPTPSEAPARGA